MRVIKSTDSQARSPMLFQLYDQNRPLFDRALTCRIKRFGGHFLQSYIYKGLNHRGRRTGSDEKSNFLRQSPLSIRSGCCWLKMSLRKQSRHWHCKKQCLLRANSGHRTVSITSSANCPQRGQAQINRPTSADGVDHWALGTCGRPYNSQERSLCLRRVLVLRRER